MKNYGGTLWLLLVLCLIPVVSRGQDDNLKGNFILVLGSGDKINQAIETAVSRLSFVTRPVMRGRLRRLCSSAQRIGIDFNPNRINIKYDNRTPVSSPSNGALVGWTREDGERLTVRSELLNGRLIQTFRYSDLTISNSFSAGPDGKALTLLVTVQGPRLARPFSYKLFYKRN
jgi:hypothetical protein